MNSHNIFHSHTQGSSFREGMTLNQYLSSMKTIPKQQLVDDEKVEEDLYQTSRKVQPKCSQKLITYQIRQCDQDNYQQCMEENISKKYQQINDNSDQNNISYKNIIYNIKTNTQHKDNYVTHQFRIRRQSNSPYLTKKKQNIIFSPNKILSQTHYLDHDWKIPKEPQASKGNAFSTIYGKFANGLQQINLPKQQNSQKSVIKTDKERHFKAKNIKEIERIAKYQKGLNEKYSKYHLPDVLNMRIQGIPDKLCERKLFMNKKTK